MNLFKLSLGASLVALLTLAGTTWALPADRDQAITIHSDRAERDETEGTTTYAGNVIIEQGSMRIEATRVTIYNDKSKVTKIIAEGRPARYQQKPNEEEEIIVAQANRLEYNIAQETLHLIDQALLTQEGTSLSGSRIDYDVRKSVVKAGGETDQTERVRMVIPARSLQHEEDK